MASTTNRPTGPLGVHLGQPGATAPGVATACEAAGRGRDVATGTGLATRPDAGPGTRLDAFRGAGHGGPRVRTRVPVVAHASLVDPDALAGGPVVGAPRSIRSCGTPVPGSARHPAT